MTKEYIFSKFKSLTTNQQKVDFLIEIQSYNLNLDINYTNLIQYWSSQD